MLSDDDLNRIERATENKHSFAPVASDAEILELVAEVRARRTLDEVKELAADVVPPPPSPLDVGSIPTWLRHVEAAARGEVPVVEVDLDDPAPVDTGRWERRDGYWALTGLPDFNWVTWRPADGLRASQEFGEGSVEITADDAEALARIIRAQENENG